MATPSPVKATTAKNKINTRSMTTRAPGSVLPRRYGTLACTVTTLAATATTYDGTWQPGSAETVETKVRHGEASGAYHDH